MVLFENVLYFLRDKTKQKSMRALKISVED